MFVAWRDLLAAKGRFALIGVVVALITVLVTFLSGLTGGLAEQNVSAVASMRADRVVFAVPGDESPSYADSAVTADQAAVWGRQHGVTDVEPLGISTARISAGTRHETVTLFGGGARTVSGPAPRAGHVVMSSQTAQQLEVKDGDRVRVGPTDLIADISGADLWYSHLRVARLELGDWQASATRAGGSAPFATVLAVNAQDADYGAADAAAGTVSKGVVASLTALGSFTSEIGSLLLMVIMLFLISALVVGAFFTVWTIQRQPDVAVLKAMGATNRMLTRDALGQALVLLVLGVGAGIGVTATVGALAGAAVPFVLSPLTTLVPGLIITALGLLGAAAAIRSMTRIDPLTALGSNR